MLSEQTLLFSLWEMHRRHAGFADGRELVISKLE
jgi:hypothetical protein